MVEHRHSYVSYFPHKLHREVFDKTTENPKQRVGGKNSHVQPVIWTVDSGSV
jgi:hypothetical protein